jgi:hypothetical protein
MSSHLVKLKTSVEFARVVKKRICGNGGESFRPWFSVVTLNVMTSGDRLRAWREAWHFHLHV